MKTITKDLIDSIEWLGHSGFRITSDIVVYIDPYDINDGPQADLILISHNHYDHCSPTTVKRIQKKDTVIIDLNGKKIYHTGDSDLIPEMKTFKTNVALLPVSGIFVMTPKKLWKPR